MESAFRPTLILMREVIRYRKNVLLSSQRGLFRKKKPPIVEKCPNETCGKKQPKKKRSLWKIFCKKQKEEELPPCVTKEQIEVCDRVQHPEPDLCKFEGIAYPTCAKSAFIIQNDIIPHKCPPEEKQQREDDMVKKIETHPALKDKVDPMPPFQSAELRLIQLCERKLHPLYKKYLTIPPRPSPNAPEFPYKSRSSPFDADDIPKHLNIDKALFDKKNIYADFKKVEPPVQLLNRMLEMQQNARPTLGPKMPENKKDEKDLRNTGKSCGLSKNC